MSDKTKTPSSVDWMTAQERYMRKLAEQAAEIRRLQAENAELKDELAESLWDAVAYERDRLVDLLKRCMAYIDCEDPDSKEVKLWKECDLTLKEMGE